MSAIFYSCVYWIKLRYCVIQIFSILNNFCLSDMLNIEQGALNFFLLKILYIFLWSVKLYFMFTLLFGTQIFVIFSRWIQSFIICNNLSHLCQCFLLSRLFCLILVSTLVFLIWGVFYPLLPTFCVLIFYVFLWSM